MSILSTGTVGMFKCHRRRISMLLTVGVGILFVLVLSLVLFAILKAAGDVGGAQAVRGVAYVCLTALLCDLVALVVGTALAVISLLDAVPERFCSEPVSESV